MSLDNIPVVYKYKLNRVLFYKVDNVHYSCGNKKLINCVNTLLSLEGFAPQAPRFSLLRNTVNWHLLFFNQFCSWRLPPVAYVAPSGRSPSVPAGLLFTYNVTPLS